ARPRRPRPQAAARGHREILGRAGGPGEPGARHRRGRRDHRGRARALPHPAGLPAAHAARPHGHARRVPPFRADGADGLAGFVIRFLSIPIRVYYQDTDAGGVVFHAQYLAFMERARTELLNEAGVDLAWVAETRGVQVMVSHLGVKYHRAARLNELLAASAEVVKIGR